MTQSAAEAFAQYLTLIGAEEKEIFMYPTATTAGDEIGWDFVTAVINNKVIIQCLLQRNDKKIPNN